MKTEEKICECGHPEYNHTGIGRYGNGFCMWAYCDCKKFKEKTKDEEGINLGTIK